MRCARVRVGVEGLVEWVQCCCACVRGGNVSRNEVCRGVCADMGVGAYNCEMRGCFECVSTCRVSAGLSQIDAIGTKRFDSDKSGDREVQRTMLELLNQLDGFSTETTIKVHGSRHRCHFALVV